MSSLCNLKAEQDDTNCRLKFSLDCQNDHGHFKWSLQVFQVSAYVNANAMLESDVIKNLHKMKQGKKVSCTSF